jgi:hypothetical protein
MKFGARAWNAARRGMMIVAAIASVLYAASWFVSWNVSMPMRLCTIDVEAGMLTVGWGADGPPPSHRGAAAATGSIHRPYIRLWPDPTLLSVTPSKSVRWIGVLRLPLWMVWAPMTAAAVWMWSRRPRYGPGRCAKCGYEMAGLTGCPECGDRAPDLPR